MLMDRIIGAFTFRNGVYAEVEKDTSFTPTAWAIVAVATLSSQLGSFFAGGVSVTNALIGTVIGVASFAVGAYVIAFIGKSLFKADVSFDEVVRTVGLANVWGVVGLVGGLLGAISSTLLCVASPLLLAAWLISIAASLVAVHEALDLDWVQTAITVVLGFVAMFIVSAVVGGIFGLGTALFG